MLGFQPCFPTPAVAHLGAGPRATAQPNRRAQDMGRQQPPSQACAGQRPCLHCPARSHTGLRAPVDTYLAGEEYGGIVVLIVVVVEAVVLVLPLAEVLEGGGGVAVDLQPLLLLAQDHHLHHGQPHVVLQAGVRVEPRGDGGQGKSQEHMEGEREPKIPNSRCWGGAEVGGERGRRREARSRRAEKFERFPLLLHFSAGVSGSSPSAAASGRGQLCCGSALPGSGGSFLPLPTSVWKRGRRRGEEKFRLQTPLRSSPVR
ncbi:uncharacterized protein LOC136051410 [Cyrtonyx montezumae]|uniref:uncharacterized protein LOC136051410 n=1 Tax=Cyrtonyx montezumae TaxID=9017 RepID=UPI0032D9D56C